MRIRALSVLGVVSLASGASCAGDQFRIVAQRNADVPGVPGAAFATIGPPVVDDTGEVYFFASWGISAGTAAIFSAPAAAPSIFLREDGAIPGIAFPPYDIRLFAVSPSGIDSGVAVLTQAHPSSSSTDAIIHLDTAGATLVHLDGEPAPAGPGDAFVQNSLPVSISRAGHVAYTVGLENTPGGGADDRALFVFDPADDSHRRLVTEGDPFPSGGGTFAGIGPSGYFDTPTVNSSGHAAFRADGGVFVSAPGAPIDEIVRIGQVILLTDDPVEVAVVNPPRINDAGDAGFGIDFAGTAAWDAVSVWFEVGAWGIEVGQEADHPSPGPNTGVFSSLSSEVLINAASDIAFRGRTSEDDGSTAGGLFVFKSRESLTSTGVAYEGGPAPGGGVYTDIYDNVSWDINDAGQVLFACPMTDAGGTRETLFVYSPDRGVRRLLAVGETIAGQTVSNINGLSPGIHGAGALSNTGQIAVRVRFDSGDDAVVRTGACPADFAEPFGSLDFSDVIGFLVAFGAMSPNADLSSPYGELNFDDLIAFLIAFGAGCP